MARITTALLVAALAIGLASPVVAADPDPVRSGTPSRLGEEAGTTAAVCDVKASVGGGELTDELVYLRVWQELGVYGFNFPPDSVIRIEFYSMGQPSQVRDTVTDSAGSFVEYFAFEGDDPPEPVDWTVAVYPPDTDLSCTDFISLWLLPATPFTDIDGNKFEREIAWLFQSGITAGCTSTLFCPKDEVNRQQMAAFLSRALELGPASQDYFDDDETSPHEDYINRLREAGLTVGCGAAEDRTFCPKNIVNRQQMAAFLFRAFQ